MTTDISAIGPAEQLTNLVLKSGWTIQERLSRDPGDSGFSRSACYRAMGADGRAAFVKAYDFKNIELSGDTEALEKMVAEYNNERRIHEHCRDKRLSRITNILDHGVLRVNGDPVHYIVCEYAEHSLSRAQPPGDSHVTTEDRLIALRKVASAILQLHSVGVAHQDIKHSNVAYFNESLIKLTDLGSASCKHLPPPPHDSEALVGQPNLAPYELLYDCRPSTWRSRFACDTYLLGNLIFTAFVGVSITPLVLAAVGEKLQPANYSSDYDQVLPDLVAQHHMIIDEFVPIMTHEAVRPGITDLVRRLCHPDPVKRGMGRVPNADGIPLDLQRAVGSLNTLATRARLARI